MERFARKDNYWVYALTVLTFAGVFVADLNTPLGIVVWVVYLVPVVLSLFVWRPVAPPVMAAVASLLMVYTYLTDAPGVSQDVARINRAMGIVTVWLMAGVGYAFIRNKIAVRRQQWLQSGQARLGEKLAGNQTPEELGRNVVGFLAEYLEAQAGVVYVEHEGAYRRPATYAVPEGSVPERFRAGEGRVGQAVRDARAFHVREVPEGYLSVSSALGKSTPRHLLIAPAAVDGVVNAVVELGFVHPVYSADQELLERIGEPVAMAVRAAAYRARLQALLEETQRQAEELQAQGEELRVSNEELEEQSRALKESQARLELQQAELEQSNAQLEEQTSILETQKDDLSRAKNALTIQAQELEQASRYKSEFLANMSHELRTPLNSSLILAKLLADNRDGNLTAEQVKYANTIYSAGNDLLTLINDILDLSKIEAGRVEVETEEFRLERLLESLERVAEPVAVQKGLRYWAEVSDDIPTQLITDRQKLEQVLKNLLSNALKFTDAGEVVLEVRSTVEDRMVFAVRDTGIGIPREQQGVIFEAFRQADGTTSRKFGGTGLGLSISRELVRLLGGDITVSSQAGRGSTFTVTLPRVYDAMLVRPATPPTYSQVPKPQGQVVDFQLPTSHCPGASQMPSSLDRLWANCSKRWPRTALQMRRSASAAAR